MSLPTNCGRSAWLGTFLRDLGKETLNGFTWYLRFLSIEAGTMEDSASTSSNCGSPLWTMRKPVSAIDMNMLLTKVELLSDGLCLID
ncbi:hypothetical protein Cob_v009486 [Colletotrichum orbiculare MAFF 240422]|uniref:Uncharacterized protein n=1 Tax=Colletotrichum orbiculare (strain 104-T / ATCC 96160 / CBS 514.97 / LARS 414 / MAFF 240422) TaxID=1213857 RepID=A0A484FJK5_COLOR|nr:hypothetical protein Cob_v009486 [Colletotrichum orbiculare MAFF 240422]